MKWNLTIVLPDVRIKFTSHCSYAVPKRYEEAIISHIAALFVIVVSDSSSKQESTLKGRGTNLLISRVCSPLEILCMS